ncbi:MAG: S8 family serine peptidase [Nevskia sp.]|nr:S8 family serine peptidase [Nevskia sp.]
MPENRSCARFVSSFALTLAAVALPAGAALQTSAGTATAGVPLRAFGVSSLPAQARTQTGLAKLDGGLIEAWQRLQQAPPAGALNQLSGLDPSLRLRLNPPLAVPQIAVDAVTKGDPQALRQALVGLGLQEPSVFSNDVGGWLPLDQVGNAAALAELHGMHAARPHTRVGAVTSQGDYAVRADIVRTSTNLSSPTPNGGGVTVGVLSDSFDCYTIYQQHGIPAKQYAANGITTTSTTDASTGDLPPLPPGVKVLEEGPCLGSGGQQGPLLTDEGRGLLQTVYDVAPGVSLAFHTAANTEADFANGIVALAGAGAKVIVDDVGYSDEPVFQDGLLAQAINQVEAAGVAYFSSAGNDGRNSYENLAPSFPVIAGKGANAGEKLLNFDVSGSSQSTVLPLSVPALSPGQSITFILEWDQPFVTGAAGSPGAASALDFCYTDASGVLQACSGANAVGGDPLVLLTVGNPADASGPTAAQGLGLVVGLVSGSAPNLIKIIVQDDGLGTTISRFQTNSPTLQGHPGAAGAAAVGAAFFQVTPRCGTSPATLESFSSAGGDPILFDTNGTRLAVPVTRQKPDFVAPDGGNTTFFGQFSSLPSSSIGPCQNVPAYPNFFGTSAAAPHAAGVAALLLQLDSTVTPAQIYSTLQNTAATMRGGVNFDSGFGLIQADAAVAQLTGTTPNGTGDPPGSSGGGGGGSSGGGSSGGTPSGSSGPACNVGSGNGSGSNGGLCASGSFDWSVLLVLGLLLLARPLLRVQRRPA